jgi:hypothetical protein
MTQIPKHIKDYASNANYYIEAAEKFTYPSHQAVRLLLLTAWENIKIAEEELNSLIQKTIPSKKLHKSHAYKFEKAPPIARVEVGLPGTKAKNTFYKSAKDFENLISICRYGSKTGSRELKLMFKNGWFLDHFESSLISKIKWYETSVKMYEELFKSSFL